MIVNIIILIIVSFASLVLTLVSTIQIKRYSERTSSFNKTNVKMYMLLLTFISFVISVIILIGSINFSKAPVPIKEKEFSDVYIASMCESEYENGYADCMEDIFNGTLDCDSILNPK